MDLFWILSGLSFLGVIGLGLQILSLRFLLGTKNKNAKESDSNQFYPPISILKPISGLDDHLFDNLISFCSQEYPQFEILFSLESHNDPAYRVVEKVKEKFPEKDLLVIVEDCHEGLNPKVSNMLPGYRKAKYPYLLISDSNVRVEKDYLAKTVQPMKDPEVGLVTNLIRGIGGSTIGALFENLHLNSFILGTVCLLEKFLNVPCVIGKSMLMRKKDLEFIGGLEAFKDILAEDYFIGEKIRQRGQKVVLSTYMINNVNEYWGIDRFFNRHLRWGKMRWKILGYKYLSELIFNPILLSFIPLLVEGPSQRSLILLGSVTLVKGAGEWYIGRSIHFRVPLLAYLLVPLKDLLIGLIWLLSMVSNTVHWRGKRLRIGDGTILSPLSPDRMWMRRFRTLGRIRPRTA